MLDDHNAKLPSFSELKFRLNSTDALVIKDILDSEIGCCYELSSMSWGNRTKINSMVECSSFSLNGHEKVLDIGVHIGVFAMYTLSAGCKEIIESSWLDVKNLVFQWYFTKERRIDKFHEAVRNLVSAGFSVVYEGQGSW